MTALKGLGTYGNAVGVVTPSDHKQDNSGLVAKNSGNLIRPGLFWGGTASIVSGTANMSYNVAAYTIATSRGATSGTVLGGNDGTFNVVTTAAPGSNSRIDVVYHWQREFSIDGVDSNPVIGVVQGTAAASPTVPSLAAFPGAVALAQILVPTGVTATNTGTTFTHVAPFTAAAGGTVVVRNTTELNALPLTEGTYADQIDIDVTFRCNGTIWVPQATRFIAGSGKTSALPNSVQPIIQTGRITAATGASGVLPTVSFTTPFPNGILSIQYTLGSGGNGPVVGNSDALSTTAFSAVFGSTSGVTVTYYFTAIGW